MIRNLYMASEFIANLTNPQRTCEVMLNALHIFFNQSVYKTSESFYVHHKLIDQGIIDVMTTAFIDSDPQLKDLFVIKITRENEADYMADVTVELNEVQVHLILVQQGSYLVH